MSGLMGLFVKIVILAKVSSLSPDYVEKPTLLRNTSTSSDLVVNVTPINISSSIASVATNVALTNSTTVNPAFLNNTTSSSANVIVVSSQLVTAPPSNSSATLNVTCPSKTGTTNQTSLTNTSSTVNATSAVSIPSTPSSSMIITTSPPTTIQSSTSIAAAPLTTAVPSLVNATSKCELRDDFLHILFNRTTANQTGFSVEQSVGIVGTREEILRALANVTRNYTRQQIEACLDQYGVPERPAGRPDSSAASHLSYARPSHLGAVPAVQVPKPPSSNFEYGHGYSTYLSPYRIAEKVPDFQPHRYLRANSIQDIFFTAYRDFQRDWDTLFQYGQPAYWFGRNK